MNATRPSLRSRWRAFWAGRYGTPAFVAVLIAIFAAVHVGIATMLP